MWLGLWWQLAAGSAGAQEVRVAVVAGPDDAMGLRLATELRSVGLDPVAVAPAEGADPGAPPGATGAVAWFHVVAPGVVRVVVPDDDGEPVSSELRWDPADAAAESLVGVQAVELLRAGLLETRDLGRRGDRLSLAELAFATATAGRGVALSVGPLLTAGATTNAPIVAVDLGVRVPVGGQLVVTGELSTPMVRSAFRGQAGVVYLAVSRLGIGARWRLRDADAGWVPDVGVAAGAGWMGFAYDAAPQFLGRDERSFLRGYAGLRAGLSTPSVGPVGGRFDLRVDGSAPAEVALDGEVAGRWSPVTGGFALLVDVVF